MKSWACKNCSSWQKVWCGTKVIPQTPCSHFYISWPFFHTHKHTLLFISAFRSVQPLHCTCGCPASIPACAPTHSCKGKVICLRFHVRRGDFFALIVGKWHWFSVVIAGFALSFYFPLSFIFLCEVKALHWLHNHICLEGLALYNGPWMHSELSCVMMYSSRFFFFFFFSDWQLIAHLKCFKTKLQSCVCVPSHWWN